MHLLICPFYGLLLVFSPFVSEDFTICTIELSSTLNKVPSLFNFMTLISFLLRKHECITLFSIAKFVLMDTTYFIKTALSAICDISDNTTHTLDFLLSQVSIPIMLCVSPTYLLVTTVLFYFT